MRAIQDKACSKPGCENFGKRGIKIGGHGWFTTKSGRRRRYRCKICGATVSTNTGTAYSGLRCTRREFDQVASLRVEGVSISATARLTARSRNTVARWLERASRAAERFNRQMLRDFEIVELQADELHVVTEHHKGLELRVGMRAEGLSRECRYGRNAFARVSADVDGMLSERSVGTSKREPALLRAGDPRVTVVEDEAEARRELFRGSRKRHVIRDEEKRTSRLYPSANGSISAAPKAEGFGSVHSSTFSSAMAFAITRMLASARAVGVNGAFDPRTA